MYINHSPGLITTHLVKELNQKRKQLTPLCWTCGFWASERAMNHLGLKHKPIYQMAEPSLHRNSEVERAEHHLVSIPLPLVSVPQQIELKALAAPPILSLTHTTTKAPLFASCPWMETAFFITCYSPSTHRLVPLCFTRPIKWMSPEQNLSSSQRGFCVPP